ncbi:hypothetical protein AgCh_001905 [Apium graveolens]
MPPTNFPLRWETTGHQWWYASPIDWAAANGHYELVKELLYDDPNLLFKLTSLRRIHRLETMWDDELEFDDVAKNRSQVAQKLLMECENRKSALVGSGYGGWLLYTAASAGDLDFVKKLLEKDSLLVFGEGEYGVTDILYAAARSKSSEVFRLLIEFAGFCGPLSDNGGKEERKQKEVPSVFEFEMTNRVVHAAARGGNLEVLKEFLEDCSDVLEYRDSQESTLLHTASGRGQIEIVKYLMSTYEDEIITSKDKHGNTALHVAAYRGYLAVIDVLISTFPFLASATNNNGDTLLHMAVASFRTPGFRRQDRQIEFMKQLVHNNMLNMQDLINVQNNEGKTALHMAITENIHTDLVELLMKIPEISFNIHDASGRTPLDLIRQQQQLPSSETLRKYLYSGRISKFEDYMIRRMLVSHIKMHGIRGSPGSSFRVVDAEIMYLRDADNAGAIKCGEDATCPDVLTLRDSIIKPKLLESKRFGSVNQAAKRLKILLQWPMRKDKNVDDSISLEDDNDSLQSYNAYKALKYNPQISLRQRFSQQTSLPNSKRVMVPWLSDFPNASTKSNYNKGLGHGVLKMAPRYDAKSPSSPSSESSKSSHISTDVQKGDDIVHVTIRPSSSSVSVY